MEIQTTCKDVGTWQSFKAQLCSISTTSNRLHLWCYTAFLHCLQHNINNMHIWIDFFFHVIVLIANGTFNGSFSIFLVHCLYTRLYKALSCFELIERVITNDIVKCCFFGRTIYAIKVIKAFIVFCMLWSFGCRKHLCQFKSKSIGIHHFAFCITRVHTYTMNGYLCACSIKVFVF